jgi:hypothetical protein
MIKRSRASDAGKLAMTVISVAVLSAPFTSTALGGGAKSHVAIAMPGSVRRGVTYHLTVSGNSGTFTRLAVLIDVKRCASTAAGEFHRQPSSFLLGVAKLGTHRHFKKTFEPLPGSSGSRYMCAYLYSGAGTKSPQLQASNHFSVVG